MRYENKGAYLKPFTAKKIKRDGITYANPTEETLQKLGVWEKADDYDTPPEEREGYYYVITPIGGEDGKWHKQVDYYPIEPEDDAEGGEADAGA